MECGVIVLDMAYLERQEEEDIFKASYIDKLPLIPNVKIDRTWGI